MAKVVLYLVLAAFVAFFTSTSAASLRHSKKTLFNEHFNRVNAFTCSEPQLRAFKPEELGLNVSSDESYYPSATVLKRCSCAGYCARRDMTCLANTTETVELVFRVVKLGDTSEEYRTVNATNETSCSCQTVNQIK